jgi:hypothetical protein
MKYLYYITLLSAGIILQSCSSSKILNSKKEYHFPNDWLGSYKGIMFWHANNNKKAEIPIKIEILESGDSNTLIWRTTYEATKLYPVKNVKDYKIIRNDSLEKGHYLMDEGNGIYLDLRLIDNSLYSCFDVAIETKSKTTRLVSIDKLLNKNVLYHEVISYPEPYKKTGKGNEGTSEEFTVKSTEKISTQKATLRRIE